MWSAENDAFLAVVPWWAVWPFETLVIAKRHLRSLLDFGEAERDALADISEAPDDALRQSVRDQLSLHDGLPPSAHATVRGTRNGIFTRTFYPPLLRSATVRKFMVGFEMLGMPQRDITPETAAERLKAVPAVHFTER